MNILKHALFFISETHCGASFQRFSVKTQWEIQLTLILHSFENFSPLVNFAFSMQFSLHFNEAAFLWC